MSQPLRCPDATGWRELLNGTLPEDRQAALAAHLESCPSCQQALASMAAGERSWSEVASKLLAAAPATEAALCEAMQHLQGANGPQTVTDSSTLNEVPLDFLTPSTKPGHLGRLAHYEVLQVIGRGGFGVVLKAFDEVLHRIVAIKVLAPQLATSGTARKRFSREAHAAAAINHDHVVTIHAVDEANGLPFMVMEFVSGSSLQERLDQSGPMEVKEILRIGMQAALGLAAAHKQGLVHRDIKPANILLENGIARVKITDFGLARAVDDASLTQSGVVAGTPQYMAPEQARGEAIDHRADLFSLGSVLYALCTGHPPFRASTALAVLKRVSEDTPRPIREINPDVPDWLVAIIARLHAKDPAERVSSAAEVAELLGQHLAHLQQPQQVPLPKMLAAPRKEPPGAAPRQLRRWPRLLARLAMPLLVALAIAPLLALALWPKISNAPLRPKLVIILYIVAASSMALGAAVYALAALASAMRRRWQGLGFFRFDRKQLVPLLGGLGVIGVQALLLFGVLGETPLRLSGRLDDLVVPKGLLHVNLGDQRLTLVIDRDGAKGFFNNNLSGYGGPEPTGNYQVWGMLGNREVYYEKFTLSEGDIKVVDVDAFQGNNYPNAGSFEVINDDPEVTIKLEGDDRRLECDGKDFSQIRQNLTPGVTYRLRITKKGVFGQRESEVIESADLALQAGEKINYEFGRILYPSKSQILEPIGDRFHADEFRSIVISPDGKTAVWRMECGDPALSRSPRQGVIAWDTATGKEKFRFEAKRDGDQGIAFSADSQMLAFASGRGVSGNLGIVVCDSSTGAEKHILWPEDRQNSNIFTARAVAFSPDGKTVAASSTYFGDGQGELKARSRIVRWDLESGKELPALEWQDGMITKMAFSPDSKNLALVIGDYTHEVVGRLVIWQVEARKPEITLNPTQGTEAIECLAFSPDGKYLAAGCCDRHHRKNTIFYWGTTPKWFLWKNLDAGTIPITSLAFSADGKILAASNAGAGPFWDKRAMIRLWNLEGYTTMQCNLIGHDASILAVGFRPDGTLLSAGRDATLKHWDQAAKQVRMVTSVHRTTRSR